MLLTLMLLIRLQILTRYKLIKLAFVQTYITILQMLFSKGMLILLY
jgi:hypothetical protein